MDFPIHEIRISRPNADLKLPIVVSYTYDGILNRDLTEGALARLVGPLLRLSDVEASLATITPLYFYSQSDSKAAAPGLSHPASPTFEAYIQAVADLVHSQITEDHGLLLEIVRSPQSIHASDFLISLRPNRSLETAMAQSFSEIAAAHGFTVQQSSETAGCLIRGIEHMSPNLSALRISIADSAFRSLAVSNAFQHYSQILCMFREFMFKASGYLKASGNSET